MNEKDEERNALVLGALLHDIGKFEFRARRDFVPHERYGEYFISEHLGRLRSLDSIRERIRRYVSYHHYAELASASLQEADHTSAAEREADRSTGTRRPLISVFSQIDIGKGARPQGIFSYSPGPVKADDPFPVRDWDPEEGEIIDLYAQAWKAFLADVREMPDTGAEALIDTLVAVMEKHLCRVPSAAYRSTPDISLFDHSRMVAALAVCAEEAKGSDRPFLAIQGDVSGIQKFIYRLASPGATKRTAKRLRGRSLFISLLGETVSGFYLRKLSLPRTSLVFSGGGHFLILAPNLEATRQTCAQTEQEVNRWLHGEMRGDLGLVTAMVEASSQEIRDFAGILQRIGYEMAQAKRRKFRSAMDEAFFQPLPYDQTMDVCAVCQRDFEKGSGDGNICDLCEEHVELGRCVVQARYLVQVVGQDIQCRDLLSRFRAFGVFYALPESREEVAVILNALKGQAVESIVVRRLNDNNFLEPGLTRQAKDLGLPAAFGFQFIGNYAPQDRDGPLEFQDLAEVESENYPILGIVRMDVDSLGTIFNAGLVKENRTPSRLASLSREMGLFFQGYLNRLAEEHQVYITYSGGDDLFAVGSWKKVIDFSQDVRRDFGKFACGNANVTLSAGLLFCKPDLPIGRAAEACGQEEEKAKQRFPEKKDAVSVFGEVVPWDRMNDLLTFADQMFVLVEGEEAKEGRLPRSFVHRLIQMRPASLGDPEGLNVEAATRTLTRNMARLRYLVARHGGTSKVLAENDRSESPNPKLSLMSRLVHEPDLMREIIIPASYVLYRTRTKEGSNGQDRSE